ncbi:MAG: ferrochelatase [Leptospiraceae bacterium]|nr:ferrochelatase [Leptospiraceae bacterium]
MKSGLLLINLGSPASTKVRHVRSYLREFLSDPDVIDLPALGRNLLLYGVILPFRPSKSAHAYQTIWADRGSPLIFHTEDLTAGVAERLKDVSVKMAMRYGKPSIADALKDFARQGIHRIHAIALYPQYSSASMGSTYKELLRRNAELKDPLFVSCEPAFYGDEGFKSAWEKNLSAFADLKEHHFLFSFHGIPERQVLRSSENGHCSLGECCHRSTPDFCYRAQCLATARTLAERLGLGEQQWEMTFQSRLGRTPWLKPYTDIRLHELPGEGKKKIALVSPSFVADCLETLEELNVRAREDFLKAGGESFVFVSSLNSSPAWIDAVATMGRRALQG